MSAVPPQVIRLQPQDAGRYVKLRRRMLESDPWAFAADLDDDTASDPARVAERLAQEENAIFAIENPAGDGSLVAATGVGRNRQAKFAHRAQIWGVFVEPAFRGRGFGKAVMQAAVALARTWPAIAYLDLSVSANSSAARALYAGLGFQVWGREPEATEHAGQRYDEVYMTLPVSGPSA